AEELTAVQGSIRRELEARGALVFEGDDTSPNGPSVYEAYEAAFAALAEGELYDPASGATT
ncbi:MAG TPA: hypothetical protein VK610_07425, partial [Rhodothermales bacterium]|nr:hypothetical protein [Rhodothermales bacterium]